MIFMVLKGHVQVPANPDVILDVIPVDMVASAIIAATAAIIANRSEQIYHLGSSDSSPFRMARSVELTGLYKRRHFRDKVSEGPGDTLMNRVRSRIESVPVSKTRYQKLSLPLLRGLAEGGEPLHRRLPGADVGRAAPHRPRGASPPEARRHRPAIPARGGRVRSVSAVYLRQLADLPLRQYPSAVCQPHAARPHAAALDARPDQLARVFSRHPPARSREVDLPVAR